MIPPNQVLRRHLENAASGRVHYGDFVRSRGVKDFLLEASLRQDDPRELAARALEDLRAGDKGEMDFVVCIAVIGFLDECCGAPAADTGNRRHRDLAAILGGSPGLTQYRQWATSWYPP